LLLKLVDAVAAGEKLWFDKDFTVPSLAEGVLEVES
jgi:hypothetical protein